MAVARELDYLFASLRTEHIPIVTPSTDLARLTLINVVDRDVQRRASTLTTPAANLTEKRKQISEQQESAIAGEESIVDLQQTSSPEQVNVVDETTSTHDGLRIENASDATHSDTSSFVSIPYPDQTNSGQSSSFPAEKTTDAMEVDTTDRPAPLSDVGKAMAPPPIPMRPTLDQNSATVTQEVENWARQQDVREVMQNVLSQLRWAIRPQGQEKNGEQVDIVSK